MKRIVVTIFVAILLVAIALVVGALVYFERDTWVSSRRLSNALHDARSVTFVEFISAEPRLSTLARRAATRDEISRLKGATSPWFLPFRPRAALCFEPHHRVEIVRAEGTELTFEVCFLCGNFQFATPGAQTGEPTIDLPDSWRNSLASFFASISMAPKTYEEYSEIERRINSPNSKDAQNKSE